MSGSSQSTHRGSRQEDGDGQTDAEPFDGGIVVQNEGTKDADHDQGCSADHACTGRQPGRDGARWRISGLVVPTTCGDPFGLALLADGDWGLGLMLSFAAIPLGVVAGVLVPLSRRAWMASEHPPPAERSPT